MPQIMPALSDDTKSEHIALVRRVLVQRPDASLREIREALEKIKRPLHLRYINKIVKKIRGERGKRIENQLLNEEIAKFEDSAQLVVEELWKLSKSSSDDRARVSALKAIMESQDMLLNRKFDAGFFERSLGSIEINHNQIEQHNYLIIQAIENSRLFPKSNGEQRPDATVSG